jgi:alkylated DNA repair dioxygenase AlkB
MELFAVGRKYPAGFSYFPDFISEEEEARFLGVISQIQLHAFNFQGYQAKRKVASFGYDYSFADRQLKKGQEIPRGFDALLNKVANHMGIDVHRFAELLVTEYPEQSVINWHRDAPPFDVIAGVSLLSDCTFRLRPHLEMPRKKSSVVSVNVSRRSLYIIEGEARTEWQHSTTPVHLLRYSITLRTLRNDSRGVSS